MEVVLKTNNLTKKYHNQIALNNVNIEVKKGDIFGLIGKNGAGKTTLLKMICGLTIPYSGEINLFHETTNKGLNKSRTRIGSIIETPSFFPYLSARKNLEYYMIQRGIAEKDSIDYSLKVVGLQDVGNKKFKNFSLGMKQRLGLALTIMSNPDLLILDEPINGLDSTGIAEFREILLKLNREKHTTIIISSHILSELSQLANTYGFINNGILIEQISAKELNNKCRKSLNIKVNNTEKAVAIIEREFGELEYEILNDNKIKLYNVTDIPEKISKVLINNEILLFSISLEGASLENYFINLIGEEI